MQNMNWNYPTTIWFGLNRSKEIQLACDSLSMKNPLIVTDPGLLQTNIIEEINSSLHTKTNIFSDVQGNPTGKNVEEQKILLEILNTSFKDKCYVLDNLNLSEILPIIKNCNISICNDSSFSHLSSGLGIKTIVLMSDTPLLYGSYSPRMYPIIPDGENTVTHNTLGKDRINPNKIFELLNNILY